MYKKKIWYFGLEPLKARYTYQLSEQWIPNAFKPYDVDFIQVRGAKVETEEILVGSVLDATGRGIYALSQCQEFLKEIRAGRVQNGDVLYIQDFWHPGLEAIFYALDLYDIELEMYTMCHAQSVDEYDFTHNMRSWMRFIELGYDARMTAIFVGSTIHKEQMRAAGFNAPIHVVSLPIDKHATEQVLPDHVFLKRKLRKVVYSSRLDKEKNPHFMLQVAKRYLKENPNGEWVITTSGQQIKSTIPGLVDELYRYASEEPRFKILEGLTKEEYYTELATCEFQFNSSLQDYVSWTLIEATIFGATPIYPNFRSFPEILPDENMYKPGHVDSALKTFKYFATDYDNYSYIGNLSDMGRRLEAFIMSTGFSGEELNIWHEADYIKQLLKNG